jgi:hypothetical protein
MDATILPSPAPAIVPPSERPASPIPVVASSHPPAPTPVIVQPLDEVESSGGVDILGGAWKTSECGEWRGMWVRRGRSNVFDAVTQKQADGSAAKTFTAIVAVRGKSVYVMSRDATDGRNCSYEGTISADGKAIYGQCTFSAGGGYPWEAHILPRTAVP